MDLAVLDTDTYWECGSGSRSMENSTFCDFKDQDPDPLWFGCLNLDPDLDPHFDKKLDPDPH
jgi:hypothetical protein